MARRNEGRGSALGSFLALAAGVGVFAGLRYGLGLSIWMGALVGAVVLIVVRSAFARRHGNELVIESAGVSRHEYQKGLREGDEKVRSMKSLLSKIRDSRIRTRARKVIGKAEEIMQNLRDDPGDFRRARQFLGYYLDATINILGSYATLSEKGRVDGSSETAVRLNSLLEKVESAFEKQLDTLLDDDYLDLDTEMKVLDRTIDMEGLGES